MEQCEKKKKKTLVWTEQGGTMEECRKLMDSDRKQKFSSSE